MASQIFTAGGSTAISLSTGGVATFTSLPECSAAVGSNNQLVNKTYADTKVGSVSAGSNITVGGTATAPSVAVNATLNNIAAVNGANNTAVSFNALGSGALNLTAATGTTTIGSTGLGIVNIDTNGIDRIRVGTGGGVTINPTSTASALAVNSAAGSSFSMDGTTGVVTFANPPLCTVNPTANSELTRKAYVDNLFTNLILDSPGPILRGGGTNLNSGNYNDRTTRYIAIGNLCFFQMRLSITAKTGLSAGDIEISLPLPIGASQMVQSLTIGNITGLLTSIVSASANTPAGGGTGTNSVTIAIRTAASTGTTLLQTSDINTTFQIRMGGFYFTT